MENSFVRVSRDGNILVATVDNPPVNALAPGLLEALADAVDRASSDVGVRAVVVIGAGRTFIAGADIRQFPRIAAGQSPPINYAELLSRIESSPKPVIMAIHGTALGGGLETAMAGHWRIALASAQLGQPEVRLGLIPGAGGTQRLPRLAGVEKAMEMCAFGESIGANDALQLGIVDKIVEENDLLAAAVEFARAAPAPRRTRDLNAKLLQSDAAESLAALFRDACRKRMRGQTAPLAALDAVAATSRLSFDEGVALEQKLFEEALYGPQSEALIHVFFAEREAAKAGLATDMQPLPIRRAAIAGAGTMGAGIAVACANAGLPVLLCDVSREALDRGMASIRRNFEWAVKKGKLTSSAAASRAALIRPVLDYDDFADADVVVEAIFEDLPLKKRIFSDLDKAARPDAILATNTSTLDIDEIASSTTRPDRVIGLHFFSPAHVMRLLEIVRGKATSAAVLAASMDLAKRLKKVGVLAGNCYGFIGNRMFMPYRAQAISLVEQGASPSQVDQALIDWGMAMGPLAVGDLSGLDVFWSMRQEALRRGLPHLEPIVLEDVLYERGRYGQKTYSGWFLYDDDRKPSPDPEVEHIAREFAAVQGIPQRCFTPREILDRTLLALINEGARILEEGHALRSSDIDLVYLNGYGFPTWRGGPMHYAGTAGLATILEALLHLYDELGPAWKPAALLEDLARAGKTFEDASS